MNSRVGFDEGLTPEGLVVVCPRCGGTWTHQERVEAYFRREDAVQGMHVTVERSGCVVNTGMEGNPSRRRDGIRVWFSCEGCPDIMFSTTIVQHKGQTFINDSDL